MKNDFRIKFIIVVGVLFFALPFFVSAYSYGAQDQFYVEQDYDKEEREYVYATIRHISNHAYFYIEDSWWEELSVENRNELNDNLLDLAEYFDSEIYPILTDTYGDEWKPGIDNDYRISILFLQTKDNVAGYFRTADEYSKLHAPQSNEREMIYLGVTIFEDKYPQSYIAHELMHLIDFNQKTRQIEKNEDVWLNELRAEYASTLLGYDEKYTGTNLQKRVRNFADAPNDSLVEWKGESDDYGAINMFGQYLVEQYGIEILKDSLTSSYVGIPSLNYALKKNNIEIDIAQIFVDWTIAIFVNDCSLGERYCYDNEYLQSIKAVPSLIFLPSTQESHLSLIYTIKEWAGNWYKIIGGDKGLRVEFESLSDVDFVVPYLIERSNKVESIQFLELKDNKGLIELPYFGENAQSLIILPSIQEKTSDFSDSESFQRFSLDVSTFENGEEVEEEEEVIPVSQMTVTQLRARIANIMAQLQVLLTELAKLKGEAVITGIPTDFSFTTSLEQEMSGTAVKYLQIVLNFDSATQIASTGVGSHGNETTYFGSLTRSAVVRFQNKYASEILTPLGLSAGTGYVGSSTRAKLNQLLGQ